MSEKSSEEEKKHQDDIDLEVQRVLDEIGVVNVDWKRNISPQDVLYLLNQCPFLQITDTALPLTSETQPLEISQAKSGWKIHNYKNALSSSPGEFLFGNYRSRRGQEEEDDSGGSGGAVAVPGAGTVVNQTVITAFEMVDIAVQQGWKGIQIIDGHPLMVWAAWMRAQDVGLSLEGYSPTAKDISRRRRIRQSADALLPPRPPSP